MASYALILIHADGREEPRTAELRQGLAVGDAFELDGVRWQIVATTPAARDYGLRALSAFVCQPE